MQALNKLRGMRFPDEYVTRMFFKEGLQRSPGRVLELGCGSGNNLLLFREFGWQVVGVDISPDSLADAAYNLAGGPDTVTLVQADLAQGMPVQTGEFDAIILPNFNYYVPRASFQNLLTDCNGLLKQRGLFFLRSRTCEDWRYGRGREVERNGFVLECTETGEKGLLNVFYRANELADVLATSIGELHDRRILTVHYDNPQNGVIIGNDDVVIWGRR
jgi:SAM-dependent methyltransferase